MPQDTADGLTLADLLRILWSHKWLILATTLVGGVLAFAWAVSSRPIYAVDALLQIETKNTKGMPSSLGAMADLFEATNPAETEIEIIRSRLVLGQAAQRLGMEVAVRPVNWGRKERLLGMPKPELIVERFDVPEEHIGVPFTLEVLPDRSFVLYDETRLVVARGKAGIGIDSGSNAMHIGIFVRGMRAKVGQQFVLVRRPVAAAVGELRTNLGVAEVGKKTGIIRLSFQGFDPREAARTINEVANSYVRQNVERKSAEAEKTLEFLQAQMPELKTQLEDAEQRLNQYRSSTGSVDLTEEARLALKQQVDVQQALFETQQKRKELLQLFEASHPNIKSLDSSIASLGRKLNHQEGEVKSLPLQQQEVVRLMRDVQVNTELYTTLLNNSQQLRVVKAGEIGNVRVVDYAYPSMKPVKPEKPKILLAGLLAGFVLGAGASLFRRNLFAGISDPMRIEREFNLAVFSQVPHCSLQKQLRRAARKNAPGLHVLALHAPDDVSVESLRSLRTALQFALADQPERVIVMTGPKEEVGKSFISQNIAVVLAQTGMKVLLVDSDLRRGSLHAFFGLPRGAGFSEILTGRASFESCVQKPVQNLDLHLLTSGTLPPNPSELLHSLRARDLIREWSRTFDIVLLDAPPVLAVTDAALLGQQAAATLLVLKAGEHQPVEIAATISRLRQSGVEPTGVVLNDLPLKGGRYSYAYAYSRKKGN